MSYATKRRCEGCGQKILMPDGQERCLRCSRPGERRSPPTRVTAQGRQSGGTAPRERFQSLSPDQGRGVGGPKNLGELAGDGDGGGKNSSE
jgi:hypothetical protein